MEVTMPVAMNAFFAANAITTKAHLDTCGRAALYEYVKAQAPTHWARIKSPEQYIQGYYQRVLEGYKNYKAPREAPIKEADSFLAEMEALLSSPAPVFTAARVDEKVSAKAAAAAEKAAAKEAEKAAKTAAKEAAKAAKLEARAEKAAAKLLATAAVAAKAAPADSEVAEVDGELKLLEGTLYMVKNDNVYEFDEITEKAGDFVGRLTVEETIDTDGEEVSVTVAAPEVVWTASSAVVAEVDSYLPPPGTVVATVIESPEAPVALAPVAQAKATASDVKRAATKEAKAVILRAQIARLEEQLARRQSELAAL